MSQPLRTDVGGRIDRHTPLSFSFDGNNFTGYAGDSLASALLANGVHLIGRSFKYHRPRGILAAGSDEPNALVNVGRGPGRSTPNLRMTQVELYEGLCARSQNSWPSLAFDVGAIASLFSPLLIAGFYYKTFMGPFRTAWLWTKLFEPVIRRAAGLGNAPREADPDRYANQYAHCDVLVVGGGPAGLIAALAAAEAGARVILCDEQSELGGSALADTRSLVDGQPISEWLSNILVALSAHQHVTMLPRTTAFGYYAGNFVALAERLTDHLASPEVGAPRERMWQIRAKRVILATGSIERPLVFAGNDRPGVMLADAAKTYLDRYGVLCGKRIAVVTATDSAYSAAWALRAAGAEVVIIIDTRKAASAVAAAAQSSGLRVEMATMIREATGGKRVSRIVFGRIDEDHVAVDETIDCDCLLMSAGWTPTVHLFSQSRGKLLFDEASGAFLPGEPAQKQFSVGACNGQFELADALAEAFVAGSAAAGRPGQKKFVVEQSPTIATGFTGMIEDPKATRGKAFVDFQNDVTSRDIILATREGMRSIEHIKRFTTVGMATDQGKTSNLNALAIAAHELSKSVPQVGLTSFRQPYTPTTFGLFAGHARGELFDPVRRTAIHGWAERNGAVFEDVGQWKRAHYFPQAGESMHAAVARECRKAREGVGLFDASTLGKIEVVGPDAAAFMNLMYTNSWTKLEPGRCRYGVMLNEAGFVIDDGVIGRVADDRFHVTTTTGGASRVLHQMEDYLQTEFPELRVWLTSTTEQWAVIAVQGPNSREVIAQLVEGVDISAEAMPHMSVRDGKIGGVPVRLFRVSFTGELGFEINVPADYGEAIWELAWNEAQKYDGVVYGTEAMHVMRAEKGYIIIGQETDGTMVPDDVGLSWAVGKAKPDFVGKRGLARQDLVVSGRKQLVGLLTADPKTVLEEGAQLTAGPAPPIGTAALGHVTSSYWSETLGRSIALGVVKDGRACMGQSLYVPMPDGPISVTITNSVFFDRDGERLNG